MSGRRAFLLNAGMIFGVPVVPDSLPYTAASLIRLPETRTLSRDEPMTPLFKIHGWSLAEDNAAMAAATTVMASDESSQEVWIKISRSWRTAWR